MDSKVAQKYRKDNHILNINHFPKVYNVAEGGSIGGRYLAACGSI